MDNIYNPLYNLSTRTPIPKKKKMSKTCLISFQTNHLTDIGYNDMQNAFCLSFHHHHHHHVH